MGRNRWIFETGFLARYKEGICQHSTVNKGPISERDGFTQQKCRIRNKFTSPGSFSFKMTEIRACISIHNHYFVRDVITYPCPEFDADLTEPPLRLGHG